MDVFASVEEGIRFRFPETLAAFLRDVPLVLTSVGTVSDDPAADRLSVPVYLDDPESNSEYWRWMGSDLDEGRRADRSAFAELVDAAVVADEETGGTVASRPEAEAFLRVLAEIRLVLASRMGVDVEDDYQRLDDTQAEVLDVLAQLQLLLIEELTR